MKYRLLLLTFALLTLAGCERQSAKSTEYEYSLKSTAPEVRVKGIQERVKRYGTTSNPPTERE